MATIGSRMVLVLMLVMHMVELIDAASCPHPAKQGSRYTLAAQIPGPMELVRWFYINPVDNVKVIITECYASGISCQALRQGDTYSSTLKVIGRGQYWYNTTLTIESVVRSRDQITWFWETTSIGQWTELGNCDLQVYAFDSSITCDPIQLLNTGTPSSPSLIVSWMCHISHVYPRHMCLFQYRIGDMDNPFVDVTSSHVTKNNGTPSGDDPMYYDNNQCILQMPVTFLLPEVHRFKVTIYPDVASGSPVSLGQSKESSTDVDLGLPDPVCDDPDLTSDNTQITMSCTTEKSLYANVECNFTVFKNQGGDIPSCQGVTRSNCTNETPPSCTNLCTGTVDIKKLGVGDFRFWMAMYPVLAKGSGTPKSTIKKFDKGVLLALPQTVLTNCPAGSDVSGVYIKAGTTATCQCLLSDAGNPLGQAYWVDGQGQQLPNDNLSLDYDVHNSSSQYTCRGSSQLGEKDVTYTPQFAYGPSSMEMTINEGNGQVVTYCGPSDSFPVTCTIQTASVNPQPTVVVEGVGSSPIAQFDLSEKAGTSMYTFHIIPEVGGNLTIRCKAVNSIFSHWVVVREDNIIVRIPPTTAPEMSVDDGPALTSDTALTVRNGTQVVIHCRVQGGHPLVSQVTIRCAGGQNMSDNTEVYLNLNVDKSMNIETCTCSATHETGCYDLSAKHVLSVLYAPTVTSYLVNTKSEAVVEDGESVTLTCSAEGNPAPGLSVRGQRSGLAVNELTSSSSPSNYKRTGGGTKVMGCRDTDVYRCNATNDIGTSVRDIKIFVRCTAQLVAQSPGVQKYSAISGTDMEVRVDIMGYPEPAVFSLSKTGAELGRSKRDVLRQEVDYSASYQRGLVPPEGAVLLHMYDLDEEDSGQYVLTIDNGVGDGLDYTFVVTIPQENDVISDGDEGLGTAALVGIVVGGVLFLVVIVLVLIAGRRYQRRKEIERKQNRVIMRMSSNESRPLPPCPTEAETSRQAATLPGDRPKMTHPSVILKRVHEGINLPTVPGSPTRQPGQIPDGYSRPNDFQRSVLTSTTSMTSGNSADRGFSNASSGDTIKTDVGGFNWSVDSWETSGEEKQHGTYEVPYSLQETGLPKSSLPIPEYVTGDGGSDVYDSIDTPPTKRHTYADVIH